ncbi:MAG: hypothetical protein KBG17_07405 [Paludibacteraceae bacterium]|nr:hypothetical protein [Paludibacteraceae bacterium]
MIKNTKIKICFTSLFLLFSLFSYAGPPFNTDDPAPVDYKHWEFYVASINTLQSHNRSGTSPHFEMNYGVVPNMQLHLLLPLNYSYTKGEGVTFGYSNTEVGIKYRFLQETSIVLKSAFSRLSKFRRSTTKLSATVTHKSTFPYGCRNRGTNSLRMEVEDIG